MPGEIKTIRLERILPNSHRDMKNYPIHAEKVDALVRSITNGDIGVWPRIIARQTKAGYEMAFGHHLLAAARKAELVSIPIIVMDLDDEKMLQYMGRENGEEFGTDFIVLLNTWEAGAKFLGEGTPLNVEPVEIARILGWVQTYADAKERMTTTAKACNAAFKLITGGYLQRNEFKGMSVETARNIAQRALSMLTTAETSARETQSSTAETATLKNRIATGVKRTAAGVRSGAIAPKDVRQSVETNAYLEIGKGKTIPKPLFDRFAYNLCATINSMLSHDKAAVRLAEIEKNLKHVQLAVDLASVDAVQGSLIQLVKRGDDWNQRLRAKRMKNVPNAVPMVAKRGE